MEKTEIVERLISRLRDELEQAVEASKEAARHATDPESRAESKWDTQGLEASYLAAGQADQARQWGEAIALLEQNRPVLTVPCQRVETGALVAVDFGGGAEFFFVSPAAGGEVLEIGGESVTIVTVQSPVVVRMLGKREGESFELMNGRRVRIVGVQ